MVVASRSGNRGFVFSPEKEFFRGTEGTGRHLPKRIIDGEGVWRSEKLSRVMPVWIRAEYANLIPLALANGVFESDPALIWSQVYSFNRPDIKAADVVTILEAFEVQKLLFRWFHEGKMWGYWVGIEKPGRLPGESRRGVNEKIGAQLPIKDLVERMQMDAIGIQKLLGFGFGSGFGLGLGSGVGAESKEADSTKTMTGGDLPLAFTGRVLRITQEWHDQLQSVYQGLSVAAHYGEADLWLVAHEKDKPRKNQLAFMRNWLAKAVNGIGATQARIGAGPSGEVRLSKKGMERASRYVQGLQGSEKQTH